MYHEKIIRFPEIKEKTGLSRSTIFRMERSGIFPKRRLLGAHSVGWILTEVDQWISSRSIVAQKENNR